MKKEGVVREDRKELRKVWTQETQGRGKKKDKVNSVAV